MAKKVVMSTNEALAEAALRAGCRFFVGYPITPATEILEYMAEHMEEYGGVYLQPESEVAGMNMICGAGAGGTRCMTASSGEGFDLFQEGISAAAGWEIPCVVVNMCRSGPGRAGMGPSQADYFQVCKGGGHGDYHAIVLAPWNAQETVEITKRAFNLADKYRMVVIIFGDAILSHVSEPVEFDETPEPPLPEKDWALNGCKGRQPRKISGGGRGVDIERAGDVMWGPAQRLNTALQANYAEVTKNETTVDTWFLDDSDLVVTAWGSIARVAMSAVEQAREEGIKVGLIRPVTLWPFPSQTYAEAAKKVRAFLTVEMSAGQMIEDVRLATGCQSPMYFFGHQGGMSPTIEEILEQIRRMDKEVAKK